jgi:hypothetical protein
MLDVGCWRKASTYTPPCCFARTTAVALGQRGLPVLTLLPPRRRGGDRNIHQS